MTLESFCVYPDLSVCSTLFCGMFLATRKVSRFSLRVMANRTFSSGSFPEAQSPIYFDREDVKKVIHAPVNQTWRVCSEIDVFPTRDASLPPALTVLPDVIERSNRTVIIHGQGDYILIAEGTRLVLQK